MPWFHWEKLYYQSIRSSKQRIILMKRNIFFHVNKYFSSWKEIFLFMKIIRKRQLSTWRKMRITLLIDLLFTAYRSDFKKQFDEYNSNQYNHHHYKVKNAFALFSWVIRIAACSLRADVMKCLSFGKTLALCRSIFSRYRKILTHISLICHLFYISLTSLLQEV